MRSAANAWAAGYALLAILATDPAIGVKFAILTLAAVVLRGQEEEG